MVLSAAGLVWTLAAAAAWCPDLRIRPTGPHFVRERSVVENRLQKTAPKNVKKKAADAKNVTNP